MAINLSLNDLAGEQLPIDSSPSYPPSFQPLNYYYQLWHGNAKKAATLRPVAAKRLSCYALGYVPIERLLNAAMWTKDSDDDHEKLDSENLEVDDPEESPEPQPGPTRTKPKRPALAIGYFSTSY